MSDDVQKSGFPIWHVAIDRGGTFVDLCAQAESGERRVLKLLAGQGQEGRGIGLLLEECGGLIGSVRGPTRCSRPMGVRWDSSRQQALRTAFPWETVVGPISFNSR